MSLEFNSLDRETAKQLTGFPNDLYTEKDYEDQPEKYRPITIPPVLVRGLHWVLAARLERAIIIGPRQRGFRSHIDGCRDNICQLDFILKQQHQSFKPLYMASVDVRKAFRSLSHPALIAAMRSFGAHNNF